MHWQVLLARPSFHRLTGGCDGCSSTDVGATGHDRNGERRGDPDAGWGAGSEGEAAFQRWRRPRLVRCRVVRGSDRRRRTNHRFEKAKAFQVFAVPIELFGNARCAEGAGPTEGEANPLFVSPGSRSPRGASISKPVTGTPLSIELFRAITKSVERSRSPRMSIATGTP